MDGTLPDILEVLLPAELPIVCSLNATDLTARVAEIADLGRYALLESHYDGTRAELRFAAAEDVRARVDAIVAAESQCCAFLTMSVGDDAGAVILTINAPDGAELVVQQLVAAFRGEPQVAR